MGRPRGIRAKPSWRRGWWEMGAKSGLRLIYKMGAPWGFGRGYWANVDRKIVGSQIVGRSIVGRKIVGRKIVGREIFASQFFCHPFFC